MNAILMTKLQNTWFYCLTVSYTHSMRYIYLNSISIDGNRLKEKKSLSWRLNNNNRELKSHLFSFSLVNYFIRFDHFANVFLFSIFGPIHSNLFVLIVFACSSRVYSRSFSISRTFVQIIQTFLLFEHIIGHYIVLQSHPLLKDLRSNDNFTA